jgi:hypothetical protein
MSRPRYERSMGTPQKLAAAVGAEVVVMSFCDEAF